MNGGVDVGVDVYGGGGGSGCGGSGCEMYKGVRSSPCFESVSSHRQQTKVSVAMPSSAFLCRVLAGHYADRMMLRAVDLSSEAQFI